MNRILNDLLIPELEKMDVRVMVHRQTPPNDGCICVGQILAAGGER
jgi:hydrogenase maturation factor HypF (carbamoyltransferase family)